MTALTPAAIEAAARAGYEAQGTANGVLPLITGFDDLDPYIREMWLTVARAMLTAAAPLLTADAVDQAVAAERERCVTYLRAEEAEHRRLARDAKERAEDGDEIAAIFATENGRAAAVLKLHAAAIARTPETGGDRG